MDDLKARYGDRLWLAKLDVTDMLAIPQVVNKAFADLGMICSSTMRDMGCSARRGAERRTDHPKSAKALFTTCGMASMSVTSSLASQSRSPYLALRSSIVSSLRTVPAIRSPVPKLAPSCCGPSRVRQARNEPCLLGISIFPLALTNTS